MLVGSISGMSMRLTSNWLSGKQSVKKSVEQPTKSLTGFTITGVGISLNIGSVDFSKNSFRFKIFSSPSESGIGSLFAETSSAWIWENV